MFRITKVFENMSTTIFRIEGKISDENLELWITEINFIHQTGNTQIILDLSRVWFLGEQSLQVLMNRINERLFLLNCSTQLENRLIAAGMCHQLIT